MNNMATQVHFRYPGNATTGIPRWNSFIQQAINQPMSLEDLEALAVRRMWFDFLKDQ